MKEDYKLRTSDWIPLEGFINYMNRNERNEKTTSRCQALHWYNKGLCIVGILTATGVALEKMFN